MIALGVGAGIILVGIAASMLTKPKNVYDDTYTANPAYSTAFSNHPDNEHVYSDGRLSGTVPPSIGTRIGGKRKSKRKNKSKRK